MSHFNSFIYTYEESDTLDSTDINESWIKLLDSFFEDYLINLNIYIPNYHVVIISLGLKLCVLFDDVRIGQQEDILTGNMSSLKMEPEKGTGSRILHLSDLNHTNNMHNNDKLTG